MNKLINFVMIILLLCSCGTTKVVTEYKEKLVHDSIVKIDTVYRDYHIKGDTVFKNDTLINIDTIIKYRTINIDTLRAKGNFSNCEGGVTNSKPFLNLFEEDINIKIEEYNKTIKVKDTIIKEYKQEIDRLRNKPFWDNTFFYTTIIFILVSLLLYKFR